MNTTGYAFLTKEQLEHLYGPNSPYNNSETLKRLTKISPDKVNDHIERDIEVERMF
jgi:hypothetical protein